MLVHEYNEKKKTTKTEITDMLRKNMDEIMKLWRSLIDPMLNSKGLSQSIVVIEDLSEKTEKVDRTTKVNFGIYSS
jgi:hypothetical protein